MINLIPKEEKKRMTINFYYKLTVLFLMVLSFCILIASASLVPAYIFSSVKNTTISAKLEAQKNELVPLLSQQTLGAINSINNNLTIVESAEKNKFLPSQKVVDTILLKKMSSIKITQILYSNDQVQGRKVSILGTAPSREVLLLFREALESDPTFKSIDLPISNFIKGSNIQFYLDLIPK